MPTHEQILNNRITALETEIHRLRDEIAELREDYYSSDGDENDVDTIVEN